MTEILKLWNRLTAKQQRVVFLELLQSFKEPVPEEIREEYRKHEEKKKTKSQMGNHNTQ